MSHTATALRAEAGCDRLAPGPAELIKRHLGLARGLARQYRGRRLDLDDLVAEANLGLVDAANRYDVRMGTSFHAYATKVIRSQLRDALARAPVVRQSRVRERAALRQGDEARGWEPYGVAVEQLGVMPAEEPVAEALDECLAACTAEERALVDLMVAGCTVCQAGVRMGLTRRRAREIFRGAQAAIGLAFRVRGYELPPATSPAVN